MAGYKFQIEREEGVTTTVEFYDEDASIHTLVPIIKEFLIAAGFSEGTINQYFREVV
jgi:hypothetical protein